VFCLVEEGVVTIESSQNAKGSGIGTALNKVLGKESTSAYSFKEVNWGERTHEYLDDVKGLEDESIQEIVEKAMTIAGKHKMSNSVAMTSTQGSEPHRCRCGLVDVPEN
jgi:hypothetical protein